mgnify:CR=1 FL=1
MKTFEQKLIEARTNNLGAITTTRLRSDIAINDALRRESIKSLTAKLEDIYDVLNLDHDMLHRKIANSRRSEYGRVPALINILATTYSWPIADNSRAADITSLQEDMLDELPGLDGDVLLDLKESKGYHSFLDEAFETVDGIEPDYEEYEYFVLTVADALQLPYVDNKITEQLWNKNENKALAKIDIDKDLAAGALARHKDLLAS